MACGHAFICTLDWDMKVIAAIGLIFFAYCGFRVVSRWESRNAIEKTTWFGVIAIGGGWCIFVLLG